MPTTVSSESTTWTNNHSFTTSAGESTINCELDLSKAELPILLVITLIFNSISLTILFKIRDKCKGVDYVMVVSLATNDFVTTLVFTVMWLATWMSCSDTINPFLCGFLGWLASVMVIFSAWVVIIMAGVRYLATVKPLYYRAHVTNFTVIVGLGSTFVWTMAQLTFPFFGLATPYLYYSENRICAYNFSPGMGTLSHRIILGFVAVEGLLATVVILFFNCSIIYTLRRNNKIHTEMATNNPTSQDRNGNFKRKRAAFANVTKVVSAVFCFCYTPFLVRLLYDVIENTYEQNELRHSVTMTMLFMSPLLNPLIYVACNRRYRDYIVTSVRKLIKPFTGAKRTEESITRTNAPVTTTTRT